MTCFSAIDSQIFEFFSVPHEILFLQHKVFREYAKIAVGPDFIHTLPSFLIITAMGIYLKKNPPTFNWLPFTINDTALYKALQSMVTWMAINAVLWLWLILQRVIYCTVWTYWTSESEYRDIPYLWWQRVWALYYAPPLQPPTLSAGFISWIICMLFSVTILGCAISIDRVRLVLDYANSGIQGVYSLAKAYLINVTSQDVLNGIEANLLKNIKIENENVDSEMSSIGDDCRSEISTDIANSNIPKEIHPISYGTNWTPKPDFTPHKKELQKKMSLKSLRTVTGVPEFQENEEKISPRQIRYRRGCHTVIPSNSSEKSSGC